MHSGSPERFIGIDVADAAHQRLVEEHLLDAPSSAPPRGEGARARQGWIQGVATDVRNRRGNRRSLAPPPPREAVCRRREFLHVQVPEGALVDEIQGERSVVQCQAEARAAVQVRLRRRAVVDAELAGHPEVSGQRPAVAQLEPEELAAPDSGGERGVGQFCGELRRAAGKATDARVAIDVDSGDATARNASGEPTPHALDLWQFRQWSVQATEGSGTGQVAGEASVPTTA